MCIQITHKLLAGVVIPAWIAQHMGLTTELARGLMPYMAGAIILCLGLGAHLPGTRRP